MSTCDATAAECVCREPAGHEPPHECENRDVCGGKWNGTYLGDDFEVVEFPMGSAADVVNALVSGMFDRLDDEESS